MTFEPVLAWWVFGSLAALTLVLRMYTLYRVLVVVGRGGQRKVVVRWSLLTLVIVCLLCGCGAPRYRAAETHRQRVCHAGGHR